MITVGGRKKNKSGNWYNRKGGPTWQKESQNNEVWGNAILLQENGKVCMCVCVFAVVVYVADLKY